MSVSQPFETLYIIAAIYTSYLVQSIATCHWYVTGWVELGCRHHRVGLVIIKMHQICLPQKCI